MKVPLSIVHTSRTGLLAFTVLWGRGVVGQFSPGLTVPVFLASSCDSQNRREALRSSKKSLASCKLAPAQPALLN